MVITQQDGCHKVIGDVTKIETSIDAKNLDFITTLLSSNLYSNPEQSFIREIVSNAWDSHVEAGTTNTPILISYEDGYIMIRDYGTGLSYDKFVELYCSIGNSSKRDSNIYIGGFGIGRYSSLAINNTVEIISYYNGKKYIYFLSKTGNTINTDFIDSYETDEPNGLQVKIKITSYQYQAIMDSLKYISFFPNIFLKNLGFMTNIINDSTIYNFNNFAVSSVAINNYRGLHVLIGNVLYPLDRTIFNANSDYSYLALCNGLAVKLDIGTVNITPNRENIVYTPNTIKIIKDRLKQAHDEVLTLISDNVELDKQDFKDYIKTIRSQLYFNFRDKIETPYSNSNITIPIQDITLTYKGIDYTKHWKDCRYLAHLALDTKYYCGKFKSKQRYYNNTLSTFYNVDHIYKLKNFTIFNTLNKNYILSKIKTTDDCIFISDDISLGDIISHNLVISNFDNDKKEFVKLYFEEVIQKAEEIDFNDQDYKDFKEEQKRLAKEARSCITKDNRLISLMEIKPHFYTRDDYTISDWKKRFQKAKSCIVIIPYTQRHYYDIVIKVLYDYDNPYYRFYTGSEQSLKKIKKLNLSNVIDIPELCSKNKVLSILKTLCSYNIKNDIILTSGSPSLKDKYRYIEKARTLRENYSYDSRLINIKEIPEDVHLINLINNYNAIIDKCKDILSSNYDYYTRLLLCMKQKLFSPSIDFYKDIKNNLIYKVLCQKLN